MSPHAHLREWFTLARISLIRTTALDRAAGRPIGTLSRFLQCQRGITLKRYSLLTSYYPALAVLGYQPPPSTASNGPQMGQ